MLARAFLVHVAALLGRNNLKELYKPHLSLHLFQTTVISMKNYTSVPTDSFREYRKSFTSDNSGTTKLKQHTEKSLHIKAENFSAVRQLSRRTQNPGGPGGLCMSGPAQTSGVFHPSKPDSCPGVLGCRAALQGVLSSRRTEISSVPRLSGVGMKHIPVLVLTIALSS